MKCLIGVGIGLLFAGSTFGQVTLPPGFEFVNLTNDEAEEEWFRMNHCGEIVFSKQTAGTYETYEIYRYDNGAFQRLTQNNVADRLPEINNFGSVVWQEETIVNPAGEFKLMMYENRRSQPFNSGYSPRLNDLSHVAWNRFNNEGCELSDSNIFFDDGTTVRQLTSNELSNQVSAINSHDEIVWTRYDFCPSDWQSDIIYWENGETTQITVGEIGPQIPEINDLGTIAWVSDDVFHNEFIKVLEDGNVQVLADFSNGPKLNNLGDIAYTANIDGPDGGAWLFVKADDAFYQLSDNDPITGSQDINDWGEVVIYMNFGWPHTDVGLLRRIRTGDSEFDGDVDEDDALAFEACYTGPGRVDRLCDCRFLDIDHDGDVDCDDWTIFKSNWNVEIEPPPFETCDGTMICEGDANGDGAVDPLDSGYVLARLGCAVEAGDPACDAADVNVDRVVDPLDVGFVLSRFGQCE